MRQHQQRIFWIYQKCARCQHVATTVYTPDLLNGPVESECHRRGCGHKWSLAIEINGVKAAEIRRNIEQAERLQKLIDDIEQIREGLRNDP